MVALYGHIALEISSLRRFLTPLPPVPPQLLSSIICKVRDRPFPYTRPCTTSPSRLPLPTAFFHPARRPAPRPSGGLPVARMSAPPSETTGSPVPPLWPPPAISRTVRGSRDRAQRRQRRRAIAEHADERLRVRGNVPGNDEGKRVSLPTQRSS